MLLYKFIFNKIINSIFLSLIILSSILYIFSIIELMSDTYDLLNTLVLGLINTVELLITIPTIIYFMSIVLFWNDIKKRNELLIIRHYLSFKKLMLIFLVFVILFSFLEINKNYLNYKIINLKENFIKRSLNDESVQKIFFQFDDNELTITRLEGLNIINKSIQEISIYKFENDAFSKSIYSSYNNIQDSKIIMENPKIITQYSISDMGNNYEIYLSQFGEHFYSNDKKIVLNNLGTKIETLSLLKIIILVIILYTYISIFLSKKGIQKNASVLKYTTVGIMIFAYAFTTSRIQLENYNNLFQISVLLTFAFYLYKNLTND